MFNIDLIEACYLNDFNVDLKAFHKKKFEGITAELSEEIVRIYSQRIWLLLCSLPSSTIIYHKQQFETFK